MDESKEKVIEQLRAYDPTVDESDVANGEAERSEILKRFPIDGWPEMELTDYAIGQENSDETYCRWVEFNSSNLGSIRGGSSRKLIIYKRKGAPGWYYDESVFDSETDAWNRVRAEFVSALGAASAGNWSEIDDLMALRAGRHYSSRPFTSIFQSRFSRSLRGPT